MCRCLPLCLLLLLSLVLQEGRAVAQAEGTVAQAGRAVAQAVRSEEQSGTDAGVRGQVTLTIPAKVRVRSAELWMLELVDPSRLTPAQRARLEGISLGPAPRPGEVLRMPRSTLLTRIRSSVPDAAAFRLQVADPVEIERSAFRIELAQIEEALRTWVSENMAVPLTGLSLSGIQVRTPLLVPEGAVGLEFEPLMGEDLLGSSALTLLVRVDGQVVEQTPVRVRIDGQLSVMVTARPLRLGQEVTDADVKEEMRSVAFLTGQPALRRDEVVGRQTRRALGSNRVLGLEDVEDKPSIRKGDSVTLIVRTQGMLVTCLGEALQDGRKGETISVLNSSTRKQLRGKVMGSGEVQILYQSPSRFLQ